jgi:hypothetical protein
MLAPAMRRFSLADLTDKSGWILTRLTLLYPNKSEQVLANWLRMLASRNDCFFARTDHAVAMAEVVVLNLMDDHPVIYERFVWCENRQNIHHIDEAAQLYEEIKRWAKSMSIEKIIVNRSSDVPKERIGKTIGRVWLEEINYVRV